MRSGGVIPLKFRVVDKKTKAEYYFDDADLQFDGDRGLVAKGVQLFECGQQNPDVIIEPADDGPKHQCPHCKYTFLFATWANVSVAGKITCPLCEKGE